ncbi:MAG: hypothetical protein O2905_00145 [Proteobacteria bacterium]|nr:hypothetical protein [Pseudomonadota bacterium]
MIRTLAAAALFVAALATPVANAQSTREVIGWCQDVTAGDYERGYCEGAFTAFRGWSRFTLDGEHVLQICLPDEDPVSRLVGAVAAFVEKFPEAEADDFPIVAHAALRILYPCQPRE